MNAPASTPSYAGYLRLGDLLGAQQPVSGVHDELLFIVMHQTSELWMKLALNELDAARAHLRTGQIALALPLLARTALIQQQMQGAWAVLGTISPLEFAVLRRFLGQASGLQSLQYRLLEFLLGHRSDTVVSAFGTDAQGVAALTRAAGEPSLYDEALRLLSRQGLALPAAVLERDWTQRYQPHPLVEAAWLAVYRQAAQQPLLWQLAERLVDLDSNFQLWRCAHLKIVERTLGERAGTGGTAGSSYLREALELRFFPELWTVRNHFQQD